MRKNYLLGIIFFGSLWGVSETILGGFLFSKSIPLASIPMTIIAFIILTVARVYLPKKGSSTFIACVAMLYKFLNVPFFACHLLAILLLGLSYDSVFSFLNIKSKAILGFIATYLGHILFAFVVTYIVRYHFWVEEGFLKVVRYIGINGTLTALANTFMIPISFHWGQILKSRTINPFEFKSRYVTGTTFVFIAFLWILLFIKWL